MSKTAEILINGQPCSLQAVAPRTMLGDYVRDHLHLTGTHLGCEHGICGACTVSIDGQAARSCITLAHACAGADVTTIEGFDDDECMAQLRQAFTEEHALQCGYCTPGVLVAARDLVLRHPDADEKKVRLEMSGNLCRCTGYVGIVKAVMRVLAQRKASGSGIAATAHFTARLGPVGAHALPAEQAVQPSVAATSPGKTAAPGKTVVPQASQAAPAASIGQADTGPLIHIEQEFRVDFPPELVLEWFTRLEQVAQCLPGLRLTEPPQGQHLKILMQVRLGPILAEFDGAADVLQEPATQSGRIQGHAVDRRSGTRAVGDIRYRLIAQDNGTATLIALDLGYSLAGPLAQFSRGAIAKDIARKLTEAFAQNLRARLSGAGSGDASVVTELNAFGLVWSVIVSRIRGLFGTKKET